MSTGEQATPPFVADFLHDTQHAIYVEVDPAFLTDPYNLEGLPSELPNTKDALRVILGKKSRKHTTDALRAQAATLYGMLHAQYILTESGMRKMRRKYRKKAFGECPRVYCHNAGLLPLGLSAVPAQASLAMFCPACGDIYKPTPSYSAVDAADFGPTFAHLFVMTYPEEAHPAQPTAPYVPRVFGFDVLPDAPVTPTPAGYGALRPLVAVH